MNSAISLTLDSFKTARSSSSAPEICKTIQTRDAAHSAVDGQTLANSIKMQMTRDMAD